jgi:small-conductance mechanosensitive channel
MLRMMKPTVMLLVVLVGSLAASESLRAQGSRDAPADDGVATAPVVVDGVELFRLRGVSSFPAEARAQLVHDAIVAAANDSSVTVDSIRVVESDNRVWVAAGNRPLVTVVDADAALEQVGRVELATAHVRRIRQALLEYREARTQAALRRSAVATLLATIVFALFAGLIVWLWRRLNTLLTRRLQARIQSVGIQSFEVMRADRIWAAVRGFLSGVRTLVLLAGGLVYLGYVLARWPWTHGLSRNIAEFALHPLEIIADGIVANIPSLVFLIVLIYATRLALRLIRLFFEAVERGTVTLARFDPEWAPPTYKIIRIAVVAFSIIVAYPYIPGSQSEAFKGVSIFIGIVFSLGSSTAISNIIAGYMMTYRRAFKIGDRVKIGDTIGDVIETRLQVTHLRSFKNEEIVIPNSQILSSDVMNFSSLGRQQGLILHTEVGIGYETPWRQVEAMLIAAAERTSGVNREPRPFVLLKRLGDFAVTYEVNAYTNDVKSMNVTYTILHRNILDVFNEYGVQIMTPAYEGDPPEPKVVAPKDWYAAPAPPASVKNLA